MNFTGLSLATASLGAHGIKLIDEDDGWGLLSSKLEGVTHHLCAVTDEHLH